MRSQSIEPHTHISSILSDDTSKGHLFIGSVICLLKPDILSKHDITAILTCSGETFQPGPKTDQMRNTISSLGIHHKLVSASDTENYQIIQHFQDCSEFIRQHRDQGRNVLVHCHAGKSRSASIVIAYLMEELQIGLETAYKLAKDKRPVVKPNPGFLSQLQMFERTLRKRDLLTQSNKIIDTAQSCLLFQNNNTVQNQISFRMWPHKHSLSDQQINMSQSVCFDREELQHAPTARQLPLKESTMATINNPGRDFKKQKRIKQLKDQQVNDIKSKIRWFMQERNKQKGVAVN